jgi:hypothetical protein
MKQFICPDWTLAEHFTISLDYLNSAIVYVRRWFAAMINQVQGSRQNQAGTSSRRTASPVPGGHSGGQGNIPPFLASPLQHHEQRQEALQRARRPQEQAVPPAPACMPIAVCHRLMQYFMSQRQGKADDRSTFNNFDIVIQLGRLLPAVSFSKWMSNHSTCMRR